MSRAPGDRPEGPTPIDIHRSERAEVVNLMRQLDPGLQPGSGPSDEDTDELLESLDQAIPSPPRSLRWACALLGVLVLALAAPWLVGSDPLGLLGASTDVHTARDGALGVVVGSAGIIAWWRPRWALPCAATATVALMAQAFAGIADDSLVEGGGSELVHVPAIALAFVLAASAIRLGPLGPSQKR